MQLKLVERAALDDARDHVVEVSVLGLENGKPGLQGFDVEIHRGGALLAHDDKAAAPGWMPLRFRYSTNRIGFIGRIMRQPSAKDEAAGEGFWRFSLALYARPGVADALIALQDRAGSDVNLILFGLWLGASRHRRLDAAELTAAEAAIAPLNAAAVAPLRELRRRLKTADDPELEALRRRIAGVELAAERRVQYRLAASLPGEARPAPEGGRLAAAEANLALTLGGDARSPEAGVLRQALAALIRLR